MTVVWGGDEKAEVGFGVQLGGDVREELAVGAGLAHGVLAAECYRE